MFTQEIPGPLAYTSPGRESVGNPVICQINWLGVFKKHLAEFILSRPCVLYMSFTQNDVDNECSKKSLLKVFRQLQGVGSSLRISCLPHLMHCDGTGREPAGCQACGVKPLAVTCPCKTSHSMGEGL